MAAKSSTPALLLAAAAAGAAAAVVVMRLAAVAKKPQTVKEGDELPDVSVDEGKPGEEVKIRELFKGKTGILFSVPGAFTPTCSEQHLPGYVTSAADLRAAGAEVIACIAVNDPFVMSAWGKAQKTEGKVRMLADTRMELTSALGMELDIAAVLGNSRGKRFALLIKNGRIVKVTMDDDAFAHVMLDALKSKA